MKVADLDYLGCLFTFCGDDPSAGLEATTFRCELKRSYGEHAITTKGNTLVVSLMMIEHMHN